VDEARARARMGDGAGALAALSKAPAGGGPRWARREAAALEVEALCLLRRWEEARQAFGRLRAEHPDAAGPDLLYAMTRALMELGRTDEALAALAEAEAQRTPSRWPRAARFMAYVSVYALGGRPDLLRDLLAQCDLARETPAPFASFWLGVAYAAAGQAAEADRLFEETVGLSGGNSVWVQAVAERRAAVTAGPAPAALAEALGRLPALWRSPAAVRPMGYGAGRVPVTVCLAVANTAVWALSEAWPCADTPDALVQFGANVPAWARAGEPWRLVSGLFLHAGAAHLGFNLFALWLFGGFLERMAGGSALLMVYLASGLAGAACTAYLSPYPVSVGASGCVLGALAASVVLLLRRRELMPTAARRQYLFDFVFLVAVSAGMGVVMAEVDNYAHLGGVAAGAALGFGLARGKRGLWRWAQRGAAAALLALALACGWKAAVNVARGGYPNASPMTRRVEPELGVSFETPAMWRREWLGKAAGYVNLIYDQRTGHMGSDMLRYLDVMEIAPAEEGDEVEEPASESGQEMVGQWRLATTDAVVSAGGKLFRVRFAAGSAEAARARKGLYKRILESVRPLAKNGGDAGWEGR